MGFSLKPDSIHSYPDQMLHSKIEIIGLALLCPLLLLPMAVHIDYAQAGDCASKACIDVYVQDGKIIIEGHKGSRPKTRITHKPAPRIKPKLKVAPTPRPSVKSTYIAPKQPVVRKRIPRRIAPRRIAPRRIAPRKVAKSVSLSDKLIKLIPMGNIAHEPSSNAIVNIPVIYYCDLPGIFSAKVAIIGEVVDVTMRPSFLWSFGDGSFFATTSPGSAYPNQIITHTYGKAGTYAVVMVATWGGTWSNDGVARAITGEIRKVSVATVSIANAPTRLTR
jgi:hypothetical protein